ncbi:MAG: aspartyl protease family protein [Alphaproteobacteria bacterium]
MLIQRRHFLIGGAAAGLIPGLAGAQTQPARTAFDFADGKIRVPVRIKGVDVSTVLDSGGQYHAMDTKLARDLGVKASGKLSLSGIGGSATAKYSDPVDISVAGQSLAQTQFAVLDLSRLSQGVGQPVELLLGAPLFHRFLADIDFQSRTLALMESAKYETPDEGAMLPLTAQRLVKTAEVLWPKDSVQAMVDTGSDACLVLSPAAAERLGVLRQGPVSTALIAGLGGSALGKVTSAPMLTLAGQDFADVPITIAPREFGYEALIGCGLLSHCRAALDYPGGWLIMSARRDLPFRRDLTGLQASAQPTALRITHVARGGPAEKAGFRVGEKISAINGQPAVAANARLTDAVAGTKITFTLQGGKTRELTLARYY